MSERKQKPKVILSRIEALFEELDHELATVEPTRIVAGKLSSSIKPLVPETTKEAEVVSVADKKAAVPSEKIAPKPVAQKPGKIRRRCEKGYLSKPLPLHRLYQDFGSDFISRANAVEIRTCDTVTITIFKGDFNGQTRRGWKT